MATACRRAVTSGGRSLCRNSSVWRGRLSSSTDPTATQANRRVRFSGRLHEPHASQHRIILSSAHHVTVTNHISVVDQWVQRYIFDAAGRRGDACVIPVGFDTESQPSFYSPHGRADPRPTCMQLAVRDWSGPAKGAVTNVLVAHMKTFPTRPAHLKADPLPQNLAPWVSGVGDPATADASEAFENVDGEIGDLVEIVDADGGNGVNTYIDGELRTVPALPLASVPGVSAVDSSSADPSRRGYHHVAAAAHGAFFRLLTGQSGCPLLAGASVRSDVQAVMDACGLEGCSLLPLTIGQAASLVADRKCAAGGAFLPGAVEPMLQGRSAAEDASGPAVLFREPSRSVMTADIQWMARQLLGWGQTPGLGTLARALLAYPQWKSRSVTVSNWAKWPLSPMQRDYAATDAVASLEVCEALMAIAAHFKERGCLPQRAPPAEDEEMAPLGDFSDLDLHWVAPLRRPAEAQPRHFELLEVFQAGSPARTLEAAAASAPSATQLL